MASSSVAHVSTFDTRAPCVLALRAFRRPSACSATETSIVTKKRLDVLLVERGLAETRSQAQALVLAGRVPGHSKAGEQVDETAELDVSAGPRFVSRGGEKLAHALAELDVDVAGADCLDVGASTGGFTDCLLQAGAARVIALDVGYGQLHPRLRSDPRVTVLERTNVRSLDCTSLPYRPNFVTADVSFISLAKALPPALACAAPGWRALVLVKPQFEAGPADVGKGGVVRDPAVRARILDEIAAQVPEWGARLEGVVDSGLPGPKGNRELFLHLTAAG
jgi:23S rRNA (cytidine1920-2'-O)/16S rRNA (cytidine1409-2'-O)-methyltransferase